MQKINLPNIKTVQADFPQFSFGDHNVFHWSPADNCVYYVSKELSTSQGLYQLLHELGHAICAHKNYESGVELLKIEVEAWNMAQEIATKYSLKIDQKQIDQCLDSYRDWLHLRSTCPNCDSISIETNPNYYHCFNCFQKWKVPVNQRTRHYRLKLTVPLSVR